MALGFRHDELRIHPVIKFPLHPPVKAHWVVVIDALCPGYQIFIHIEKMYIFQGYPLAIHQLRKDRILLGGADRHNKHGFFTAVIVIHNFRKHGQCHVEVYIPFGSDDFAGDAVNKLSHWTQSPFLTAFFIP